MCIGFDLDNPRRNVDCGVRLGEGKVPSPRALSTLSTRSNLRLLYRRRFLDCDKGNNALNWDIKTDIHYSYYANAILFLSHTLPQIKSGHYAWLFWKSALGKLPIMDL